MTTPEARAEFMEKIKRHQRDVKRVQRRIHAIKQLDMKFATDSNIFDMTLEEFLQWFDRNAARLFRSVAYSRIKNNASYTFDEYLKSRRELRLLAKNTKSSVSMVRCNSKLRTSFTVHSGPLRAFGSTTMFDNSFTIQVLPNAVDTNLRYCVQFSGKFKKIAEQFCQEIIPEAVMRALQNIRSTAIYHRRSDEIITY